MGGRARDFVIAVLVTILDVVVISRYVPAIWGGTAWFHIVFLLFSGTMVFTLGDIWSRPLRASAKPLSLPEIDGEEATGRFRNNSLEGADV